MQKWDLVTEVEIIVMYKSPLILAKPFCKSVAQLKDSWSCSIESSVLITTKAIKNNNLVLFHIIGAGCYPTLSFCSRLPSIIKQ